MCIIWALLIFTKYNSVTSLSCYWNSEAPYKYFSTRTSYNSARGDIRDSYVNFDNCEPVSIWGLFRHGKRTPSIRFGQNMKHAIKFKDHIVSSYQQKKSPLCAQDVDNIKNWHIDEKYFENVHNITSEGFEETKGISKRLKHAFPNIFKKLNNTNTYTLRPALGYWMENAAEAFVTGLEQSLVIETPKSGNDVMVPFQDCPKYKKMKNNTGFLTEAYMYTNTPEFSRTVKRVQKRLGVEFALSGDNFTALHDLCSFIWSGIENKPSPWCALFSTEDMEIIEYYEDLISYYRNGYGMPLYSMFGSIALVDLFKSLKESKEGRGRLVVAYFTHATMMDMVYATLGLFKDNFDLTHLFRDPDRKWRSSKHTMAAANLVAVLYSCNKSENFDYKVVFYLNEEPLKYLCNEGICSWHEFEELLKPFSNASLDNMQCSAP